MKKIIAIIICASSTLLCSCQQETYKEEYESLSVAYTELESKYDEAFDKYIEYNHLYTDLKNQNEETSDKNAEPIKGQENETEKNEVDVLDKNNYSNSISYEMLARTPDQYTDKLVIFTGTITQIISVDDKLDGFRMNVDSNSDYNMMVIYPKNIIHFNLLEKDNVTIYAKFMELYTYETVLGSDTTVPLVFANIIDYNESDLSKQCSITLPKCPLIVNEYDWDNETEGTLSIEKIDYEWEENYDGTYDLEIMLTGSKTYGEKGDTYISYTLYDSDGYIIDNGIIGAYDFSAGDKFKNVKKKFYNLESGNYRIELNDRK